jgi:Ala-tRNA(Pro) deacylase
MISQTLQHYLEQHHVPYEVIQHPHSTRSLESASTAHVDPDRVAKAVVVEGRQEGSTCYLLAVLPASNQLDLHQLQREAGLKLRLATEEEIGRLFRDCELGAVPALGQAYGVETIWDDSLQANSDLYFEAGDHERLIHMKTGDFLGMLGESPHGRFSHHS